MWVNIIKQEHSDGFPNHKYVNEKHIQKIENSSHSSGFDVSIVKDGEEELIQGVVRIEYPTTPFNPSFPNYHENLKYIEGEIKNLNDTLKELSNIGVSLVQSINTINWNG